MKNGSAETRLPLTDIPVAALSRMYEYWRSKCQGGRPPGRGDIDPLDFPWALGLVCLLEVERSPLRFRYRLDGSLIALRHGEDFTGRTTDEVRPAFYADILRRHFTEVVESAAPSLYRITIRHDLQIKTYDRLAMPLMTDPKTMGMILTVSERISPPPNDPTIWADPQATR